MADLILPIPEVSFGVRIPEKPDPRNLQLDDFVKKAALGKALAKTGPIGSAPPAQWAKEVAAKSWWPAYFNHTLPTCWPAAYGHWIQVLTWNNGKYAIPPERYVLELYYGGGGYNPATGQGNQGCYSNDILRWLLNNPFGGDKHRIDGYMALNGWSPNKDDMLSWAIYSFGVVFAAVDLPQSAIDQYRAGEGHPFTVVTGPDSDPLAGHLLPIFGYHDDRLGTSTWGVSKEMTREWLWKYQRELWVVKSKEWKQLAELGFDGAAFRKAKAAIK